MKRILFATATLAMVLPLALALAAADPARERKLQQAIDLLETKGEPAKAIPLLEDVARSSDKALAARGLLYLGQAQERRAADQARAAYLRIVQEFGSEKEVANEALRRLNGLGGAPRSMQVRKIDLSGAEQFVNISRDGQWLGGTDWDTGNLILRHVSTGEVRRLVTGTADSRFGEAPVISPDGRSVAYFWADNDTNELRVMPNEANARSRSLVHQAPYQNPWPLAWSPDGKSILASLEKREGRNRLGFQLAWVSVADGAIRIIKEFELWRAAQDNFLTASLSPDGKYIAYSVIVKEGDPERAIYILSADGRAESLLIRGGINDYPVWTPDGSRIVFNANRSGASFGLWSAPVSDGKRAGIPVLAKPETGRVRIKGMSASGTLLYDFQAGLNQILVFQMEQGGTRVRGSAVPVDSFVGIRPQFSRDGRWIAAKRGNNDVGYDMVIHSVESGAQWPFRPFRFGDAPPRWYVDGSVQLAASNPLRISMSGGEPREIPGARALPMFGGVLSPNDSVFYLIANHDPNNTTDVADGIEVIDTATGQRKSFLPVSGGFSVNSLSLSPDGRTLAFMQLRGEGNDPARVVCRIQVDGSGFRQIFTDTPIGRVPGDLKWTPDGRSILFAERSNGTIRLMRIPAEGGTAEFTGISAGLRALNFDLSPDGSRLAYSVRTNDWQLWALDNLASTWSGK